MNKTNYDALTESDLIQQLEWEGYTLNLNESDQFELIQFSGGYPTTRIYTEQPTGNAFDSVAAAHRYIFTL